MKKFALVFMALAAFCAFASAQVPADRLVSFDKKIHDFGTISIKDGPQTCTFEMTNISGGSTVIYAVVSSCGCTNVQWTKQSIPAGEKGTIEATYANDEGPYPFDKQLTVYIKDASKPVTLHIRGEVTNKKVKK